jgi:hypothetical protein
MGGKGSGKKANLQDEIEVSPAETAETVKPETNKPFQPYVPTDTSAARGKSRMSFTLTPEGDPDFSSMRTGQRELFTKILSDPRYREQLGIAGQPVALPPVFTEDDIKALYVMLGPVEAYIVALWMKVPVPLAMKTFTYTETEIQKLTPSTMALANKYQQYLLWYAGAKEEINFAMTFFTITTAKLQSLRKEVAALKAAEEENNPALADTIRITEVPASATVETPMEVPIGN